MEQLEISIAQHALNLIKDIPEANFGIGKFTNHKDKCCVMGHINRVSNKGKYDTIDCSYSSFGAEITYTVMTFMLKTYNKAPSLFSINDGGCEYYAQPTPKERVVQLFTDMIAAGY